ncbi:MAG: NUDIX domain-containing protein, partial [Chromatiaceae bacterium]
LWSLPECQVTENPLDWCRAHLGVEAQLVEKLPVRRHTFSHFKLEIQPLRLQLATWPARVAETDGFIWHPPGAALAVGLPTPVARLLREISSTWDAPNGIP